uniref:Inhibitor I9 domain-containing protein n=1 Tax=Kalanchoe fedtschenkoi TaxID=63787 RepID=A0A7N0ZZU8_KALFE
MLVVLFLFTTSSCRSLPTDPDQEASSAPVALAGHPTGPRPVIYIVLTSEPPNKEDKIHFYLRILTRVFGSEEAARNALVYTYTHAITGFSAILTPRQLAKLSEQPEVVSVFKNGAVDIDQAVLLAQAPHARDLTGSALYIVLTSEPPKQEDRDQFYLRILTRVFDSDEDAKNALVISYKHAINGFAAKLTPDQVSTLLEQSSEVLTVIKDEAF